MIKTVLAKVLTIMLLLALALGQVGCATSEEDLGYKPASKQYTTSGDSSYHGWDAPPQETSSSQ